MRKLPFFFLIALICFQQSALGVLAAEEPVDPAPAPTVTKIELFVTSTNGDIAALKAGDMLFVKTKLTYEGQEPKVENLPSGFSLKLYQEVDSPPVALVFHPLPEVGMYGVEIPASLPIGIYQVGITPESIPYNFVDINVIPKSIIGGTLTATVNGEDLFGKQVPHGSVANLHVQLDFDGDAFGPVSSYLQNTTHLSLLSQDGTLPVTVEKNPDVVGAYTFAITSALNPGGYVLNLGTGQGAPFASIAFTVVTEQAPANPPAPENASYLVTVTSSLPNATAYIAPANGKKALFTISVSANDQPLSTLPTGWTYSFLDADGNVASFNNTVKLLSEPNAVPAQLEVFLEKDSPVAGNYTLVVNDDTGKLLKEYVFSLVVITPHSPPISQTPYSLYPGEPTVMTLMAMPNADTTEPTNVPPGYELKIYPEAPTASITNPSVGTFNIDFPDAEGQYILALQETGTTAETMNKETALFWLVYEITDEKNDAFKLMMDDVFDLNKTNPIASTNISFFTVAPPTSNTSDDATAIPYTDIYIRLYESPLPLIHLPAFPSFLDNANGTFTSDLPALVPNTTYVLVYVSPDKGIVQQPFLVVNSETISWEFASAEGKAIPENDTVLIPSTDLPVDITLAIKGNNQPVEFPPIGTTLVVQNTVTQAILLGAVAYAGNGHYTVTLPPEVGGSYTLLLINDTQGTLDDTIALTVVSTPAVPSKSFTAKTLDTNKNGYLDAIAISFEEAVSSAALTTSSFDVAGYTVIKTSASTEETTTLTLSLQEKNTPDTGVLPLVTLKEALGGVPANTALIPSDAAHPVIVKAVASTSNELGEEKSEYYGRVDMLFSESINTLSGPVSVNDYLSVDPAITMYTWYSISEVENIVQKIQISWNTTDFPLFPVTSTDGIMLNVLKTGFIFDPSGNMVLPGQVTVMTPFTDATLQSLIENLEADLVPVFNPAVTSTYTLAAKNTETAVLFTATATNPKATVTVKSNLDATGAVPLSVGDNKVEFVVTAESGKTQVYTVLVTRAGAQAPGPGPSGESSSGSSGSSGGGGAAFFPNTAPTANAGADITVTVLATTTFDGSLSTDKENNIKFWIWNFGDGSAGEANTSPLIEHTFANPGTYTVTLTVRDAFALDGSDTKVVTVIGSSVPAPGGINLPTSTSPSTPGTSGPTAPTPGGTTPPAAGTDGPIISDGILPAPTGEAPQAVAGEQIEAPTTTVAPTTTTPSPETPPVDWTKILFTLSATLAVIWTGILANRYRNI